MKLSIKRVGSEDLAVMRKMAVDFFIEEGGDYPRLDDEEFDKMIMNLLMYKDDPNYLFLIAYDGKKPAGFMVCFIGLHAYGKPGRVGVAQELYVVPSKRNSMIAFRLVKLAIQWALDSGVEGLECTGRFDKTDIRWERFGFKRHLTYGHMSLEDARKFINRRE
jgi:GNAT superfamily N-acetyltransferase